MRIVKAVIFFVIAIVVGLGGIFAAMVGSADKWAKEDQELRFNKKPEKKEKK